MADSRKIDKLQSRLSEIVTRQNAIIRDIKDLKSEIQSLTSESVIVDESKQVKTDPAVIPKAERKKEITKPKYSRIKRIPTSNWEKFVGENLISKAGILITVIGVFIGTKYAIDRNIIGPIARISLGYLFGGGMLFLAIRLKTNYLNFSSVLISGAMAIFYFITFSANYFFDLFPVWLSFLIMVAITIGTVYSALVYDRQFIAHMGLVGAYAIPYLLGSEDGNPVILFSYVLLINSGIIVLAYRTAWKALYYNAFYVTWVIFLSWFILSSSPYFFAISIGFGSAFFLSFYVTVLIQKDTGNVVSGGVFSLFTNSLIYLGIVYNQFDSAYPELLPWTILSQSILHFAIWFLVRSRNKEYSLLQPIYGLGVLLSALFLADLLEGNQLSLFWLGQAIILLWMAKKLKDSLSEALSYLILVLSVLTLFATWSESYPVQEPTLFLVNSEFLNSLFHILGLIIFAKLLAGMDALVDSKLIKTIFFGLLGLVVFSSILIEISSYWESRLLRIADDTAKMISLKSVWLSMYYILFSGLLIFLNRRFFKITNIDTVGVIGIVAGLGHFLIYQYKEFDVLREMNGLSVLADNIRIACYLIMFLPVFFFWSIRAQEEDKTQGAFKDLVVSGVLLWIMSRELLYISDYLEISSSEKFGLSILWGFGALVIVIIGIWKTKGYLRIAGITLIGITLIKVFFYDTSEMDTIRKTGLFVTIGIILLAVSFLYNKYQNRLFKE